MDAAILTLRIVFGLLIMAHGTQKLFGWPQGPGLAGISGAFESWGFRPARLLAIVAALSEVVGGLLLVIGLLVPIASVLLVATLLVACVPSAKNGLWAARGGYELPAVYAFIAAALGIAGSGTFGLDAVLGIPHEWWYGLAAVGLGVIGAGGTLIVFRHPAEQST